jgi:L-alanine-DL-glutamate epimerase-like enolase superfamily enzyme
MRIREINIRKENLELSKPYSISYKTVDSVENVIVELVGDNGMIGFGAANPSKYVVGEDVDQCYETLKNANLLFLEGADISQFYSLLNQIHLFFTFSTGARVALDVALHDLFAQSLNVPLVQFLGAYHTALPTSVTIGIMGVDETLREADDYIKNGFKILKLKLGKTIDEDIERTKVLQKHIGRKALVRVDANQGWTFDETLRFVEATKDLQIELIEQPLNAKSDEEYRKFPEYVKSLIAADESIVGPSDAFRLANSPKACGIYNIKLMKCGGIQPARDIATIALEGGIDLMWGCNDESIISIAAGLHVAYSCPHTKYIDLDGSLDLARDVVSGGFVIENGMMSLTGAPGLGLKKL